MEHDGPLTWIVLDRSDKANALSNDLLDELTSALETLKTVVAWPTGELGAMGPEGAVRLGFRRELEQLDDAERERRFDELLEEYKAFGRASNAASVFEIDDVIDPADTRAWVAQTIDAHDWSMRGPTGRRIDTW